jgi:hypothetical protein
MRKTLLIAAAALAAGVISSQAQVYSQNVVGYYNQTLATGGYNLVAVQFTVGGSNGASEIFPSLPDQTEMLRWDTAHATFIYNYYDTLGGATAPKDSWWMGDYGTYTNEPVLVPGTSVFLVVPSNVTNTVTGTVVSTNNASLVAGYNMTASSLPIGGATTNTLFQLNAIPDQTEFMQWNPTTQSYTYNYYDSLGGATSPAGSWWMGDYGTYTNAPILTVGQGLFIVPPSTYSYIQTFTNQ